MSRIVGELFSIAAHLRAASNLCCSLEGECFAVAANVTVDEYTRQKRRTEGNELAMLAQILDGKSAAFERRALELLELEQSLAAIGTEQPK